MITPTPVRRDKDGHPLARRCRACVKAGLSDCEHNRAYVCAKCGKTRPWYFGAADDQMKVCDACYEVNKNA